MYYTFSYVRMLCVIRTHTYNLCCTYNNIREEAIDYGDLDQGIRRQCLRKSLQDVEGFVRKCIQLYETTVVRHGLMLVGPTISGKTKVNY